MVWLIVAAMVAFDVCFIAWLRWWIDRTFG